MITVRACRICGCTDDDCSACIERVGIPCHWVTNDLCSACWKYPDAALIEAAAARKREAVRKEASV